jgi:hypothetical protein
VKHNFSFVVCPQNVAESSQGLGKLTRLFTKEKRASQPAGRSDTPVSARKEPPESNFSGL